MNARYLMIGLALLTGCESPNKTYPGMVEIDPIVTVYGPGGKLLRGPRSMAPKKSWAFTWTGWTPEERAAYERGMWPAVAGAMAANAQAGAAASAAQANTFNALQTQSQLNSINANINAVNNTLLQQKPTGYRASSWQR